MNSKQNLNSYSLWKWVLISLVGCLGCEEHTYLYPRNQDQDLRTLCTSFYTDDSGNAQFVKSKNIEVIRLEEDIVTYYFSDNRSYTLPRPEEIVLDVGVYRCQP